MNHTIDNVIQECKTSNGLEVTPENRRLHFEFIQRQLDVHKDYDLNFRPGNSKRLSYPFFDLLSDKLYIFSILVRQTGVRTNPHNEETTFIDDVEKLKFLRIRGSNRNFWDDESLYYLYSRRETNKKKSGMIKYKDIINELGKDSEVIKIWGKGISYDAYIRGRTLRTRNYVSPL